MTTTSPTRPVGLVGLVRLAGSVRRHVLLGLVLALMVLTMPPATVRDAPVSLVKLHSANGVAHPSDVVWILFLGSDARPGEDVLRSRADAIQLTGINLRTGAATMIGLPRDSYVDIPGYGSDRINAALTFGGPELMGRTVGNLVGLQPDYVFTTGFDGFRQMVNAVGGVTVDSDFAFSDPVRPQGYRVGPNKLNGFQAMIFARIRKSFPRGDFDRSANQQDVMRGILRQVRAQVGDPGFMERGVLAAVRHLNTNVRPSELYRLAQAGTVVDPRKLRGCVVLGGLGYAGAASVVFPDVAQARRIVNDARNDGTLDGGC